MLILFGFVSFYSIIHKGAEFQKGDPGLVQISAMTSTQNLFPIDLSFFCDNTTFHNDYSLGTNLIGKEIHTKSFEFEYGDSKKKELLICSKEINVKAIEYLIKNDYRLNFNLNRFKVRDNTTVGLPLGDDSLIYNNFIIYVHYKLSNKTGMNEVTGLTGISESKKRKNSNNVTFSFSLRFTKKDTGFDDTISYSTLHQIYFLIMIIANIILIIVLIYMSIKNDIDSSAKENSMEIDFEENFWYFMRGDIFRKPKYFTLLCSLTGIGFQLLLSSLFTSFMSYKHESSVLHMFFFYLLLFSVFSGFLSVRLFKLSEGTEWRTLIFYNIFLLPIIVMISLSIFQIINYFMNSSNCLSISNFLKVLCGCGIDIFLTLIGSIVSLTMKVPQLPFKVNLIPKQNVRQPFYLKGITKISIVGGFVTLNIGLSFDLVLRMMYDIKTVFVGQIFGFELFLLLFLSSFSSSLFFLYVCVKRESYNWWWSAFLGPASCGLFYLILAICFYFVKSVGDAISFVVFLMSNSMIAASFALSAGFCGFWSSFLFLRLLYGSLQ